MAPSETLKAKDAILAMKSLGISEKKVKPVLKKLLKVYEKNWILIEAENYRVLADAIFEVEEEAKEEKVVNSEPEQPSRWLRTKNSTEMTEKKKICSSADGSKEAIQMPDEPRPLKRLRRGPRMPFSNEALAMSTGISIREPNMEEAEVPATHSQPYFNDNLESAESLDSSHQSHANKGKQPLLYANALSIQERADTHAQIAPRMGSSEKSFYEEPTGVNYLSYGPMHAGSKGKQPFLSSNSLLIQQRAGSAQVAPRVGSSDTTFSKEPVAENALNFDQSHARNKVKRPLVFTDSPLIQERADTHSQVAPIVGSLKVTCSKELMAGNISHSPKKVPRSHKLMAELLTYDAPRGVSQVATTCPDQLGADCSGGRSSGEEGGDRSFASQPVTRDNESDTFQPSGKMVADCELAAVQERSSCMEIASSPSGDVKIFLHFGRRDLKIPSLDALLKTVQEKCIRAYKILDSKFSAGNVLKLFIEDAFEVDTGSTSQSSEPESSTIGQAKEGSLSMSLSPDLLKKSNEQDVSGFDTNKKDYCLPSHTCVSSGSLDVQCLGHPDKSNSRGLVVVPQPELVAHDVQSVICMNDITKGQERVEITWINEVNGECPPPFYYIRENWIFYRAHVQFSLSQIGDDNCCPACFGDCLLSPIACACACAYKTEGQFAYTVEGLLREEFLEKSISLSRNPKKESIFYCQQCPVERKDDLEHCKGHLARNFIKECWSKCGCGKQCGNRVVQRGITHKLQVFYTPDGRRWGLRTLEDLPKGAFVCEYVGEIVTCSELHTRRMHGDNSLKNSFPVLLDAAWNSGVLKDEEALYLDATSYGNIARFINHRCLDANLAEIPVEVETPDHHYYHLAFFTTRKVDALEELTWDYGIDFEDQGHLVNKFECNCGSKFCRNIKRSKRSRKASIHHGE